MIKASVNAELVVFSVLPDNGSSALRVFLTEADDSQWRLPGVAVGQAEALDTAAKRCLNEQFFPGDFYMEQLFTFGEPNRYPGDRVISVSYFVLVPFDCLESMTLKNGRWYEMGKLPSLQYDHGDVVSKAHRRLAAKIGYSTLLLQLMPEEFTFGDMQGAHECITGEQLDKRNYRKRIQSLDCIEETGRLARRGNYRPAMLYKAKQPNHVSMVK